MEMEGSYTSNRLWAYGGSINGGTPNWILYNGKSQSKMDDLEVLHYFGTPPYIFLCYRHLGKRRNRPSSASF